MKKGIGRAGEDDGIKASVPIKKVVRWVPCFRIGRSWDIAFFLTPSEK